MVTLAQIKNLKPGDTLYHKKLRNSDGSSVRVKVNGKVKLWKTRPSDFKVPVKHGLYDYGYIEPYNKDEWSLKAKY